MILIFIIGAAGVWLRIEHFKDPSSTQVTGYYSLAVNMRNTHIFAYPGSPHTPTAFRAPLYPSFLYPFAGESVSAFRRAFGAQLFLFMAALILVWKTAVKLGRSQFAGAVAAAIYSLHPQSVKCGASFQVEFFYGVILTSIAGALVLASETGRRRHYLLVFLLSGISINCKSPMILFPVLLSFVLLLTSKGLPGRRQIFGMCLAAYLVLLPWTIRNYERFNSFIPMERHSGLEVIYTSIMGMPLTTDRETAKELCLDSTGRRLYEDSAPLSFLLKLAASSPGPYLRGTAERIPDIFLAFPFLFLLSGAGAFLFRRSNGVLYVAVLTAYLTGIHSLISFEARFLIPILPLLAILASLAVSEAAKRVIEFSSVNESLKSFSRQVYLLAIPIASAYVLSVTLLFMESGQKRFFEKKDDIEESLADVHTGDTAAENAGYHNNTGVQLALSGKYKEAAAEFNTAITLVPSFIDPYLSLASISRLQGRPEDSLKICEKALGMVSLQKNHSRSEGIIHLLECHAYSYHELEMPEKERLFQEKKAALLKHKPKL